ncbi:MAG TPA: hypothetical protein VKM54_20280 [Myxococcota bacterium]|nr:hypothetical protein [Myxococcota bacterium]
MSFAGLLPALLLAGCDRGVQPAMDGATAGWPSYEGDGGGTRFLPLTQITRENVDRLAVVWTFHTEMSSTAPVRIIDHRVNIDVFRRVGQRGFDAGARPLGPSRRAPVSPLAPSCAPR